MSGDSLKPEEGGEVEVINPDLGNSEIDAQPADGDAMDAAELSAAEDYAAVDNEAKDEEIKPEQAEEDLQAEQDPADEPETQVEEVAEDSKPVWDGNPDNLPEELHGTYKTMLRGFHVKTKELADERRKTEDLQAKLLLKVSDGPAPEAKAEEHPWGPMPELPSGEGTTQEVWNEAHTKQSQWLAEEARLKNLDELGKSGQFVSAEQHATEQRQAETKVFLTELSAMDGYTDEVAGLMAHTMAINPFWATAADSREGMVELAEKAIAHVGAKTETAAAAVLAAAKITKQSTAASRATPRVTTPKGAAAEDVFAQTFKSENDAMDAAEKHAREQYGGT